MKCLFIFLGAFVQFKFIYTYTAVEHEENNRTEWTFHVSKEQTGKAAAINQRKSSPHIRMMREKIW